MNATIDDAPPCDLDPEVYNLHSAWYDRTLQRWKATKHGVIVVSRSGDPVELLLACGCEPCAARADDWTERRERQSAARAARAEVVDPPPARVDADEVRAHLEDLIEGGMSSGQIAVAAGVDYSTVRRVLKPWASQVAATTARRLLMVSP